MSPSKPDNTVNNSRWISREYSELLAELQFPRAGERADRARPDFDVLIVGSGYGGAVAAAELAGGGRRGRPQGARRRA